MSCSRSQTDGAHDLGSGGYSAGFNDTLASVEIWDPSTLTWTNGTDMPTPRGDLMCDTLAGQYVAAGGFWDPTNEFNPDSFRTEVQLYNPKTGRPHHRLRSLTTTNPAHATHMATVCARTWDFCSIICSPDLHLKPELM